MLFDPFLLGGLKLKNRIARASTFEKRCDEDGHVTDELIDFYNEIAKGGAGLIITGSALVHPSGRLFRRMICIHSGIYAGGLKKLTDRVHENGGIIFIQLTHGGRQCPPMLLGGEPPFAPSAIIEPSTGAMPRAMKDDEIWRMVDAFGESAWRAASAGFDGVEIQAAHGCLISSFLSGHTNKRNDYWGGDEERRFHFLEEVFMATRKAVGAEFPIIIKLNADDLAGSGGITPSESLRIAKRLQDIGADAVELSGGMRESNVETVKQRAGQPERPYFRDASRMFKQSLSIPVILTGGMRSREMMEDVLQSGDADMIGLSRPLLMEPDLPMRMQEGAADASMCDSCNKCARLSRREQVQCDKDGIK